MQIGDLATWVGAAGTWVAILAAALAAVFVYRQLRLELNRYRMEVAAFRDAEAEKLEDQARRVAVWLVIPGPPGSARSIPNTGRDSQNFYPASQLQLTNGSVLPIYDVTIWIWAGVWFYEVVIWQQHNVIPPFDRPVILSSVESNDERGVNLLRISEAVSMRFRDSGGIDWYRSRDGRLHRVRDRTSLMQDFEGFPADYRELTVEEAWERRPTPSHDQHNLIQLASDFDEERDAGFPPSSSPPDDELI